MSNRFSIIILSAGLLLSGLFITSCNNDNPAEKPGTLAFHIHTLIDSIEVENYGELLTRADGRKITVTMAQMYISNVKLIKTDGSVVDGPSSVILVKQGVEEYELGEAPAGSYKTVRFDVGLSDAVNASTPAVSDPILYEPSMWFGATAQPEGFVFVNFQGTIDTTDALTGTNLIPFAFKIGTNAHRITITMPTQNFDVISDQLSVVHLETNYAKLLDPVDLNINGNLNITTPEENSWAWITQMEDSIAGMFDYEE
jgi:hypothetical protein